MIKPSIKDIEDSLHDMLQRGELTLTQYLGSGLYKLPEGFIVNEKMLKKIEEKIREELNNNKTQSGDHANRFQTKS